MKHHLFTIGFTQKTLEEFVGLLKQAEVREVVDIRTEILLPTFADPQSGR